MIIWFTGISGVGKTTLAKYLIKLIETKINNLIHVDGDEFRKIYNNDLGYNIKDRNKNAERIINFVKFLDNYKINVVLSANLTSQKYRKYCKRNFKNFYEINIQSNIQSLIKRDKKNIYNKRNKKNVVGFGIENKKNDTAFLKIINNKSKKEFLENAKKISKKLILKSDKFYK